MAHHNKKFVCPILFKNDLPDIPFDPKLLEYPFDPERHFVYRPTTLEKEEKQILLPEPTLGIPINLVDPLSYYCSFNDKEKGLDAEDLALLDEHNRAERNEDEEVVTWIKRPEYMVTDFGAENMFGGSKKKLEQRSVDIDTSMILEKDHDVHIIAIEETFKAAQQLPVHPTDPELEPVEVYEFLPGDNLWQFEFMSVMFPQDPAPQPPDSKDPDFEFKSEEQADLCLRSIITPMNVNDEDFGVYFVPKLGEYDDIESFLELDINDREYKPVREYSFNTRQLDTDRNFLFVIDKATNTAKYNQLSQAIRLKRLPKKRFADYFPEVFTAESVEPSDDDIRIFEQRRKAIEPIQLVEEDELMDEIFGSDVSDDSEMEDL